VSLFERILVAILALLLFAALVGLFRHDIGRTAAPQPTSSAAGAGRFWWQ
jgi:hypothetical protein